MKKPQIINITPETKLNYDHLDYEYCTRMDLVDGTQINYLRLRYPRLIQATKEDA